jgi:uncharacterized protein (DUF488 family)
VDVLTIGHSNHTAERFLGLLQGARVARVVDVRSVPFSRWLPQFRRERLEEMLAGAGIAYAFRGVELGGRPSREALFCDGVADYEKMAADAGFRTGLERVIAEAAGARTALLCAEREPLDCHRCLLIGRRLHEAGVAVGHILAAGTIGGTIGGTIEPHAATEARLLDAAGLPPAPDLLAPDLLAPSGERLAAAYRRRAARVAFRLPEPRVPGRGKSH